MKKLIVFDLDNTLAETQQPITPRTAKLLAKLAGLFEVCVVTDQSYKQIEERVLDRLTTTPSRMEHLHFMPMNGAQYHHYDGESGKWQHERYVKEPSGPEDGIKRLCKTLRCKRGEVLFVGNANAAVKKLRIDTVAAGKAEETESVINGLIAERSPKHEEVDRVWNDASVPEPLKPVAAHLIKLQLKSREDMKQQLTEFLQDYRVQVIDHHQTVSVIFRFTAGGQEYGLKIEYGATNIVIRNEAYWYEMLPPSLKTHHVLSHITNDYAFVLMKWLKKAKTIEEHAVANDPATMDLVIQAMKQDRELFENGATVPLKTSRGSSFFFDKYHSYNASAKKYPYLQAFLDSEVVSLNGKKLPGPYAYVQRVQQDAELRKYLSPDRAGLIHGDSQLNNLLVEDGKVYMIDPKTIDPFPLEYDTGRVHWSLTGWNAILRGEFSLQKKDGGYELDVTVPQPYVEGYPRFRAYFSERDYHRALYSSIMQYLTRVSHAARPDECIALYLRGLQIFDELFNELGVKT